MNHLIMNMSTHEQTMPVVQEDILLYRQEGQDERLPVGTPAWYAWLNTARTFSFRGASGTFTARKEQASNKRGGCIKELGLPLSRPPRPAGRFVPAVQTGNLIFVSGQISVVSGQPGMKGKLGKDLSIEQGQEIVEVQS